MRSPIDAEERAWALECLAAGDTLDDLVEGSGRRRSEWIAALGALATIPAHWSVRLALVGIGLNQAVVGARLGVSRDSIVRTISRARAMGLPVVVTQSRRTPEDAQAAMRVLAGQGVTNLEIAARFGLHKNTVARIVGPRDYDTTANLRRRA